MSRRILIVRLFQFDDITILIPEPEQMFRLFLNGIFGTRGKDQRVAYNLEISRHTGGVGIENGVTLHTE